MIPQAWPGFEATRKYRGVTYRIKVKRAGAGNKVSLVVDGKAIEGDVVPTGDGKADVSVEVTLT